MLKELLAAFVIVSAMATVAFADPPEVRSMTDPQMGDHWTYTQRDEATGEEKGTYTQTVTEVQGEDVSVRITMAGKSKGLVTYDRQWNMKDNLTWRFSPHDGFGIKTPLAVGATWTVEVGQTTIIDGKGGAWKGSRTVRVVGQGPVTTRAGQFDAFEIENSFRNEGGMSPKKEQDSSAKTEQDSSEKKDLAVSGKLEQEGVLRMWYAPAINHWVKRVTEIRLDGGPTAKSTEELVEYGRRKEN